MDSFQQISFVSFIPFQSSPTCQSPTSTCSLISSTPRRCPNPTKSKRLYYTIQYPHRIFTHLSPTCCASPTESRTREALHKYVSNYTSGSDPDLERLRSLLEDANLSVCDVWLLFASRVGDAETVSALLTDGANPNVADVEGSTPLMRSISRGHVSVAKVLLLDKRIDITIKNSKSRSFHDTLIIPSFVTMT